MKFYDHVMNQGNPAVASAMARVRRESVEAGNAYRVEATPSNGVRFYWDGGSYDALQLAKDLVFNRYADVVLIRPNGKIMGPEEIKAARY